MDLVLKADISVFGLLRRHPDHLGLRFHGNMESGTSECLIPWSVVWFERVLVKYLEDHDMSNRDL